MTTVETLETIYSNSKVFPRFDLRQLTPRIKTDQVKKIIKLVMKTMVIFEPSSSLVDTLYSSYSRPDSNGPLCTFAFGEQFNITSNEKEYNFTIPQTDANKILFHLLLYIFIDNFTYKKKDGYNVLLPKISEYLNGL